MGKIEKTEPTEKETRSRDKNFQERHQSFRQNEASSSQSSDTHESGEKGDRNRQNTDRHQGFKQSENAEASNIREVKQPGSGGIPEAQTLSKAGEEPYNKDLTRAGHSFQEHGDRTSGIWEKPTGNPEALNKNGQATLDGIINSPDTQWTVRHHARFDSITEGKMPDGRGARWSADGKRFHGFLDPERS